MKQETKLYQDETAHDEQGNQIKALSVPTTKNVIQSQFAANKVNWKSNRVVKLFDTHEALESSPQV